MVDEAKWDGNGGGGATPTNPDSLGTTMAAGIAEVLDKQLKCMLRHRVADTLTIAKSGPKLKSERIPLSELDVSLRTKVAAHDSLARAIERAAKPHKARIAKYKTRIGAHKAAVGHEMGASGMRKEQVGEHVEIVLERKVTSTTALPAGKLRGVLERAVTNFLVQSRPDLLGTAFTPQWMDHFAQKELVAIAQLVEGEVGAEEARLKESTRKQQIKTTIVDKRAARRR
jgi:hypothetical protein